MGLIPEHIIGEIRQRADIVAVIGRHVQLRKSGRNHKGLCPFHQERGPSFNVSPDKGFFYCFGCHKKGDVFTFVMEYEGKSFVEAAETLAQLTGVTLPERTDDPAARRAQAERQSERSQLLRINQAAASFFRSMLRETAGAAARDYLAERQVTPDVADRFMLGYAPDGWSALGDFLAAEKIDLRGAELVGLVAPRPRAGGHYDRFRHRLVCPVMQTGGEVVGFSARTLPGGSAQPGGEGSQPPAKYINSPESPVYKKSKLLYGLYQARDAIRLKERAILVEGNFDVVSLHQAGFAEAVAPLGTALTEEQVELLRRLTGKVILFYDGDRAGRAATLKALRLLVAAGIDALIAEIPAGEDPDSLARRGGAEALTSLVGRSRTGIKYFMDHVWSSAVGSPDDYAKAIREAAELLPAVKDQLGRRHLVDHFAAVMNVSIDRLRDDLRAAYRGRPLAQPPPSAVASNRNQKNPSPLPSLEEMDLMALLGQHPELFELAEELDVLSLLTDASLRDMYSAARGGQPLWTCIPLEISPEIAEHVLSGVKRTIAHPERVLREAVDNLRSARSKVEREGLLRQMEQARMRGNEELARELLERAKKLRRELRPEVKSQT
jgi:DNA primase